jgi:hypothetical protein
MLLDGFGYLKFEKMVHGACTIKPFTIVIYINPSLELNVSSIMMLPIIILLSVIMPLIILLSVIMLGVILLSVIMLGVILLRDISVECHSTECHSRESPPKEC